MKNRQKNKVHDSSKRVKINTAGRSNSRFLRFSIHKTKDLKGVKRDVKEGMKYVKITKELLKKKKVCGGFKTETILLKNQF